MKKTFKIVDGDLHVKVFNTDKLFVPLDGKQVCVGTYEQNTLQMIDKKDIHVLDTFIKTEKENIEKQMEQLDTAYESLKDLQDIDEKILTECSKQIDRGNKPFKKSMESLNNRIQELNKKKQIEAQKSFLVEQLSQIDSDFEQITNILE